MSDNLQLRRAEFFSNIWDHTQDPFQAQFDERRPLTPEEEAFMAEVLRRVHASNDDVLLGRGLFEAIAGRADNLLLLLQLCGLTRNKIITDLRAKASSLPSPLRVPGDYKALARSRGAWELAGPYMAARARRVLGVLGGQDLPAAIEALNQATWPGFIRQERAKRSGHEGEYRLATLLAGCGLPFVPEQKADNPLCPDARLRGVSFDIVVPDLVAPLVCVKATVHTSNIGQFGESKDDLEMGEARAMLDAWGGPGAPRLLALIDGVGFRSNRAGLDGVLSKADEFCQYRTLWKAAVIASAATGIPIRLELPEQVMRGHAAFFSRHAPAGEVVPKEAGRPARYRFPAGEGFILLDRLPSE